MANEQDSEAEVNLDLPADPKEGETDTTDWKAEATKLREKAIQQRERTKALKEQLKAATEKKPEPAPVEKKKTDDFGYDIKAYLKTSGIDSSEFDFVKGQMIASGKDVDSLLSNSYFQSELKAFRDSKIVEKATPSVTRTNDAPSSSKVDYWIAKGELPPDKALRAEVVERRIELARQGRLPK